MLEEIQALKQQAGRALTTPVGGASDAAEASRAVADITRRAREEADAIIRSAEARAEAIANGARARGTGPEAVSVGGDQAHLSRFVGRERGFLQELASLIQSHAHLRIRSRRQLGASSHQSPSWPAGRSALSTALK